MIWRPTRTLYKKTQTQQRSIQNVPAKQTNAIPDFEIALHTTADPN
jgi:hypothetical protein